MNKNSMLVLLLVVALGVVVYMWMQDRESKDLNIDIGSLDLPSEVIVA